MIELLDKIGVHGLLWVLIGRSVGILNPLVDLAPLGSMMFIEVAALMFVELYSDLATLQDLTIHVLLSLLSVSFSEKSDVR